MKNTNLDNRQMGDRTIGGQTLQSFLSTRQNTHAGTAAVRLQAYTATLQELLDRLEKLVVPEHQPTVTRLIKEVHDFRSRVSLVGQVKAGKTMLTNALAEQPGLLPSDVNPWTSVVTSIHINTPKPRGAKAVFSFFTAADWANLTVGGGRLGELAERADFQNELTEIRQQVAQMQKRTQDRLGSNFNLLLGSQHRFSNFDTELLKKYVCLGDDFAPGEGSGRYADVTKSADLYIDVPNYAIPTTINDTPGVNDPFLAREQATMNSLAESDICIIVLSANQAFTTVDLALIRILLALDSEQVILFVNRIDELEHPHQQIKEIDDFIRKILSEKGVDRDISIIYGSALWSEFAQKGDASRLPSNGLSALERFARERLAAASHSTERDAAYFGHPPYSTSKTQDLSGLVELRSLVEAKSASNIAAPFMTEALLKALDVASQSAVMVSQVLEDGVSIKPNFNNDIMIDNLDNVFADIDHDFLVLWEKISDRMTMLMSQQFHAFVTSESKRIEAIGSEKRKISDWQPNTEALRQGLNEAYHSLMGEGIREATDLFQNAASMLSELYRAVLSDERQLFAVHAPAVVEPKVPASLMRTMTIDMKTTWIGNWLTRVVGTTAMVKRLSDTVTNEMAALIAEMKDAHVQKFVDDCRITLYEFLSDHLKTLQSVAVYDGSGTAGKMRQKVNVEIEANSRLVALKGTVSEIQALVDAICSDFRLNIK